MRGRVRLGAVAIAAGCAGSGGVSEASKPDLGWSNPTAAAALEGRPAAAGYLAAVRAYEAAEAAHAPDVASRLSAIRSAGELAIEAGIDPLPVPCAALRDHPEARAAFDPVWGSTKDSEAAAMREACVPSDVREGEQALEAALGQAAPLPSGTMYQSMDLGVWATVDWLLLQPASVQVTGAEAKIREAAVARYPESGVDLARDRLVGALARRLAEGGVPAQEAQEKAAAVVDLAIVRRLKIPEE